MTSNATLFPSSESDVSGLVGTATVGRPTIPPSSSDGTGDGGSNIPGLPCPSGEPDTAEESPNPSDESDAVADSS
eukprot:3233947-Lingulodinium_polyedra.AAC.1